MKPTPRRFGFPQGQRKGRSYQAPTGAPAQRRREDVELAEQIKKRQEDLFRRTMWLVRLPGGYPICYAFGCEDCLVTDYAEWNAYRDACYKQAREEITNENAEDNPETGAPFTWGFRKFPAASWVSDSSPGPLAWVLAFIRTNIWNHDIAHDKFVAWIEEHESLYEHLQKTVYLTDGHKYTSAADGKTDANTAEAFSRFRHVMSQLFAAFEGDPKVELEQVHWRVLAGMLIYPGREFPNYTPGELSRFYNDNPGGDDRTANLKADQTNPAVLDKRMEAYEENAQEAQQRVERMRRMAERPAARQVSYLTESSEAEGDGNN